MRSVTKMPNPCTRPKAQARKADEAGLLHMQGTVEIFVATDDEK